MKKLVIALFIIVMMVNTGLYAKGQETAGSDLLTLVTTLQNEQIDINGWSIHAREKRVNDTIDNIKEYVDYLERKFPDWDWDITSNTDQYTAKASNSSSHNHREYIQILSTFNGKHSKTYIIYELQGGKFTEETKEIINNHLQFQINDIFRNKTSFFTCIKGEFNDKMYTTLPNTVSHILSVLKADEIEAVTEEDFASVSAFSKLFSEKMETNNQIMNVQVGIRTHGLGGKTTLVVGTPIITIEY